MNQNMWLSTKSLVKVEAAGIKTKPVGGAKKRTHGALMPSVG